MTCSIVYTTRSPRRAAVWMVVRLGVSGSRYRVYEWEAGAERVVPRGDFPSALSARLAADILAGLRRK